VRAFTHTSKDGVLELVVANSLARLAAVSRMSARRKASAIYDRTRLGRHQILSFLYLVGGLK
jgi:hypothetical protein